MSEALRAVFLELGFDIDLPTLEQAEARIRATIKTEKDAAKEHDRLEKAKAKAAKEAEQAAKAAEKAAKDREKEEAAERKKKEEAFHKLFGTIGIDSRGAGEALESLGIKSKLSTMALFAGLVLTARAAVQFADAFAAQAEELRDTSREARVTTTQLQELEHAAAQGGVGVERMRAGVNTFGQSLRAAERWGNSTTFLLRRLGIQARDAGGHIRPTGELIDEVAVAMEHIQSPTRRARVAVQLFGESGRRMLDILHTGPGGIRALRDELAELGGGVTPEAVAASREYTQATERQARAQDSLRSVLAVGLLPTLSWVVSKLAYLEGGLARLTNNTHVVQIALGGLGALGVAVAGSLLAAWLPVAAPFLVVAAKVAALVLILDDLITFVEGGQSATGALIDELFGVGTAAQVVQDLRDSWQWVGDQVERAIGLVMRFLDLEPDLGTNRYTRAQSDAIIAERLRRGRPAAPAGTGARLAPAATLSPRAGAPAAPAGLFDAGVDVAALPTVSGTGQVVPATRVVPAPGGAVVSRTIVRTTTHQHGAIHVHGITDPNAAAERVGQILEQRARLQRDAGHPTDDEEG